jgi:hypothetical protein
LLRPCCVACCVGACARPGVCEVDRLMGQAEGFCHAREPRALKLTQPAGRRKVPVRRPLEI